jgi:hypothetical protein
VSSAWYRHQSHRLRYVSRSSIYAALTSKLANCLYHRREQTARANGFDGVLPPGTQAAKEAGNMVDLDSNPTKLLRVSKRTRSVHQERMLYSPITFLSILA